MPISSDDPHCLRSGWSLVRKLELRLGAPPQSSAFPARSDSPVEGGGHLGSVRMQNGAQKMVKLEKRQKEKL